MKKKDKQKEDRHNRIMVMLLSAMLLLTGIGMLRRSVSRVEMLPTGEIYIVEQIVWSWKLP